MDFIQLPIELLERIYYFRGLFLLKNNIEKYYLDYYKFCEFLVKYNGIIMGSFPLSCFDNTICPNDLDIFICSDSNEYFKNFIKIPCANHNDVLVDTMHMEIFNMVKGENINIYSNKYHANNLARNKKYKYSFVIENNIIDINVIDQSDKLKMLNNSIECSNIIFDGIQWIFPLNIKYISDFIYNKKCNIGNPYSPCFSDIYVNSVDNEFGLHRSSQYFQISHNINNIGDQKMLKLFKELIDCYPDKDTHKYKHNVHYKHYNVNCDNPQLNNIIVNNVYCNKSDLDEWTSFTKASDSQNDNKAMELYLKVISIIFKIDLQNIIHKYDYVENFYYIYRAWYRILKYISRGYIFTDIDTLLSWHFYYIIIYLIFNKFH